MIASVGTAGTTEVAVKDGVAFTGLGYGGTSVRAYRVSDGFRYDDLNDGNAASPTYNKGGFIGGTIGPDGTLLTAAYDRNAWEWDVLTAGVVDPSKFAAAVPTIRANGNSPVWYWNQTVTMRYSDEYDYISSNYSNSGISYGNYTTGAYAEGGPYQVDAEPRIYHAFVDPTLTPEPATLLVLALGAVAGLIRRK